MIWSFLKRFRWYLLGVTLIYVAISVWLFFVTEEPQSVPFGYQIN